MAGKVQQVRPLDHEAQMCHSHEFLEIIYIIISKMICPGNKHLAVIIRNGGQKLKRP